ncbi:MAG: hypothetical protein NTV06_01410, partial [candidate division Zixibacteria bacterium]|nr:hypothetical protein [candidate division Zixibacteria bacterium]
MRRRLMTLSLVMMVVMFAAALEAVAQAPGTITYQGRLTNASGIMITDSTDIIFNIYDDITGGSSPWTEQIRVGPDSQGVFTVQLGETMPLTNVTFDGTRKWLGLTVGTDIDEMTPRQPINAAPYAIN